jgi:hypothetical protein
MAGQEVMIDRLVRVTWADAPRRAGRVSRTLGFALADGGYLAPWPLAALLAPVIALVLGAAAALTQGGITFAYSLPALVVFAFLSGIGAGPGIWALLGYVVTDLATGNAFDGFGGSGGSTVLTVVQSFAAALISYAVLATLLVFVPLTAVGLREEVVRHLRLSRQWARPAVHALLAAVLVWAWAQAAAFLLRPVWTFRGAYPDVPPIQNLQFDTWVLVLVAAVAASGRSLVEGRAVQRLPLWLQEPVVDLAAARPRLPLQVAVPLRAFALMLLMSGLVASLLEAFVLFVALLVPLTAQALLGRERPVVAMVLRVPLVFRLAAVVVAAYIIANAVVEPRLFQSSFAPMLVAVVLSLLVAAVLLPQQEP